MTPPLWQKQIANEAKAHSMTHEKFVNKVMLLKQAAIQVISLETLGQMTYDEIQKPQEPLPELLFLLMEALTRSNA